MAAVLNQVIVIPTLVFIFYTFGWCILVDNLNHHHKMFFHEAPNIIYHESYMNKIAFILMGLWPVIGTIIELIRVYFKIVLFQFK